MKRRDRLSVPMTIAWEGKGNRKHFLKHLITTKKLFVMAEVGVRDGRTTFALLDSIPELKIYAIDTNISLFYTSEVQRKYKDRLIPIEGYSYVVADQIPDRSLDIVFIDADHSYESVKKDIIKYTPKLKDNGLLTGHDIDYPGVNKAVNEVVKEFDVGPNFVWIKK